ncbi:MAG: heavy metal translocating P-type ATPase [Vulcanimicrobiota bacterium]
MVPEPGRKKKSSGHEHDTLEKLNTRNFVISGLDCVSCADSVQASLLRIPGVSIAKLDFNTARLHLEFTHADVLIKVKEMIKSMGYEIESPGKVRRIIVDVPEMDCSEEIKIIKKALGTVQGILEMNFYIINREVEFVVDVNQIEISSIINKIKKTGMSARVKTGEKEPSHISASARYKTVSVVSGISIILGFLSAEYIKPEIISIIFFCFAVVVGGWHIFRRGLTSLKVFNFDMNVLMSIAVIGALGLQDWREASIVVFLFSIAQYLENRSMEKARGAIHSLMSLTPDKALVKVEDKYKEELASQVDTDEIVLVKPGMKVPLDGIVVEGVSYVDQSPITGESVPVKKMKGHHVYAGTINQNGALQFKVTKKAQDTTIAKVIRMVEEAQAKKAPAQAFVDKFSRYYTPSVIIIALFIVTIPTLFFEQNLNEMIYRALVLLLIACPCALVISTPVSIVTGLTRAAHEGVLIKGGIHLENFAGIDAIALDKTGTLTYGKPRVEKIVSFTETSEDELLKIAASIETLSEHPIARAIINEADERNIVFFKTENFQAVTGEGVKATIEGEDYYLGSHRSLCNEEICNLEIHNRIEAMEKTENSIVVLKSSTQLLGVIILSDLLKENSITAIKELDKMNLKKLILLSGDNEEITKGKAERLGIDYKAELLPGDKLEIIENLQKEGMKVAMVGDGINDAPALALAAVGVAMGAAGTDTALEVADVALMSDNLEKLPFSIRLARKTLSVIKQNIVIALAIKLVFLVLGVSGIATLWMAVFADMGSSLIVILNGLRLLRVK